MSHKDPTALDRHQHQQYQLYPQRWLVLFSFAALSLNSAWMWITWAPMVDEVAHFWNVSKGQVDGLSAIYMSIYVVGSFPAIWLIVNVVGLARGLWIGAVLNFMGALTRYVGRSDYSWVYVGTLCCAFAQTFTLATPPLISGNWFGAHERATATSLGVLANQFGTALGLGSTIVLDLIATQGDGNPALNLECLEFYLATQLLVAGTAAVLVFMFITSDGPPTPPSEAAASKGPANEARWGEQELLVDAGNGEHETQQKSDSLSYFESVQVPFKKVPIFVLLFGIAVGVFYTIPSFLSQLVPTWSPESRGWLGVLYQLSGVLGSFISGRVVDTYQRHKQVSTLLLIGGAASLSAVLWALLNDGSSVRLFLATSGVGFCLAAFNTVGIELGTAMTYPADEAAVAGILECFAELVGSVLVTMGGRLKNVDSSFILIQLGALLASLFLMLCLRAEALRPTN